MLRLQKNMRVVFLSVIIIGLLFLMIFAGCVIKTETTHADTTVSTITKADVIIPTVLQISYSKEGVALVATLGGGFTSDTLDVMVNTNSAGGYSMDFSDSDSNNNLVSSEVADVVESNFSGNVTSSSMPEDVWGYSLDGTNYTKIPLLSDPVRIQHTEVASFNNTSRTSVHFGAKTSATLKPATYEDTIIFTVYSNDAPPYDDTLETIFDITYMQEMTSEICSNTTTPSLSARNTTNTESNNTNLIPETTLIDRRDNKNYLVRKFADGECWMVQNLEYDFKTASGGYASDSTTLAAFDEHFIEYTDIQDTSYFNNNSNAFKSNKFYATQSVPVTQNQNNTSLAWDEDGSDGAHSYSTSAAGLPGYVVRDGGTAGDGYYTFEDAIVGEPYQKIGNYYNWAAASAGSYLDANNSATPNSICPRNWQLPSYSGDKSFNKLLSTYYEFVQGTGNTTVYNSLNGAPLDLWRTGYYRSYRGSILSRTEYGRWWINRVLDSDYAYELSTRIKEDESIGGNAGYVNSDSAYYKGYGFSIRCVAR